MRKLLSGAILILAMCVAFFAVLALDVCWRVWNARAGFDNQADVALLLLLETVRALVTLGAVGIAVSAERRGEAGHSLFAIALLFLTLWYTRELGFAALPGPLQEKIAIAFATWRVPPRLLRFVFGQPTWALAPGIAAFVAFASRYPVPIRAEDVRAVHVTGRRGMMRSVALAGLDVRSIAHRVAARAVELRLVTPVPLFLLAVLGAALLAMDARAVTTAVLGLLIMTAVLALVLLRTGYLMNPVARPRLGRLAAAGISVCLDFTASSILTFAPGSVIARLALALASLAPFGAVFFLTTFVLHPATTERYPRTADARA